MNYLKINSLGMYSRHASLRSTLNELWSTKQKQLEYRLFKTLGFATYGSGHTWYWMRKWGDTYVMGSRVWNPTPGEPPTKHFFNIFLICKKERTFIPARYDQGKNNLLAVLGFGSLQMYPHQNPQISYRYGVQLQGDLDRSLITGGIELAEEGVLPYGSTIVDPVVQIYDRGLFNKGRQALLEARRYLDVYINRHRIITSGYSWHGWEDPFIKACVQHFAHSSLPPTPNDFLEWHNYDAERSWRANKIPLPGQASIRNSWIQQCVDVGICRIVPKGTPLYTESSPLIPYEPDYDAIILAD
jgi:hypothetical protein